MSPDAEFEQKRAFIDSLYEGRLVLDVEVRKYFDTIEHGLLRECLDKKSFCPITQGDQ